MDQKQQECIGTNKRDRNAAAVYVRVSTASKSKQGDAANFIQNPDVQEQPLRDLVAQRGWVVHEVYSESYERSQGKTPRP